MFRELFIMAHYAYAFPAWPPFIVGASIALLGIMVLVRERASYASRSFFAMTASGAIWLLSVGALYSVRNVDVAIIFAKLTFIGVAFIPSTMFYFVMVVTKKFKSLLWPGRVALLISGLFAAAGIGTNRLMTGVQPFAWGFYPQSGNLGTLFLLFFFSIYLSSLALLYWRFSHHEALDLQPNRIRNLFIAFSVGLLGAVDFFACYGIPIYPIGFLPVYACVALLAETIWRYRFKDITAELAAPHILTALPSGLFVLDADGAIVIVNAKACEFLEKSRGELVGMSIQHVFGDMFAPPHLDTLIQEGKLHDHEITIVTPSGRRRVLNLSVEMFQYDASVQAGFICSVRDISLRKQAEDDRKIAQEALLKAYDELEDRVEERTAALTHEVDKRKRAEEALRALATTDPLTGLYNRRGFMALAEQRLLAARKAGKSIVIFLADLDDLKPLNDTFGHQEGDKALQKAAELLKKAFRESDIVARIGGDEFAAAVIEEGEPAEDFCRSRLRIAVSAYNAAGPSPCRIGISLGAARIESHQAITIEQAMVEADQALYRQKKLKPTLPKPESSIDPSLS